MFRGKLLNPQILSLVARVRHTNALVIADRGFPSWPGLETVDLSLVDDIPRVTDVLEALVPEFDVAHVYMAQEFLDHNPESRRRGHLSALAGLEVSYEPHTEFKRRVPSAVGLIRTGDTTPYANVILVSG